MIGTGTVLNPTLGLMLAVGQVPADVPEGFAAVATLRRAGIPRGKRILMAAAFAVTILVGGDHRLFRPSQRSGSPDAVGVRGHRRALTSVVVEEMVPEAHKGDTSRLGPVFLTGGFAIFVLISVYVG